MVRVSGRYAYVVDLDSLVGPEGIDAFAQKCAEARFSSVWVRLARGEALDRNFSVTSAETLSASFRAAGLSLWGWHVPFCADPSAATLEADNVAAWADRFDLEGVVVDAERTPESPRFRGGSDEAHAYMSLLSSRLTTSGRGCALSSHDQPQLHNNLPFPEFLDHVSDNCPQVYYRDIQVTDRLDRSIAGYQALERGRNFADRYCPTGNITMRGDIRFRNEDACVTATEVFIAAVKTHEFRAYGLWCLDDTTDGVWTILSQIAA